MGSEGQRVIAEVYEAFGRGDLPAVLGTMDPGIEWYEAEGMPYGEGVIRGPEAVAAEVFAKIVADVDGFTVTPERYVAEGDVVVALGRYSGTGSATGRKLDIRFAHVWELENGKIVRFVQHADTAKFLEVVPAGQAEAV